MRQWIGVRFRLTRQYGRRAAADFADADIEYEHRCLEYVQSNNLLHKIVGRYDDEQPCHHEGDDDDVVDW